MDSHFGEWKDCSLQRDVEEGAMIKLESKEVLMRDTDFCCLMDQHKQELLAIFKAMPPEEKAEFMIELNTALENGMKHGFKEGTMEEDDDEEVGM